VADSRREARRRFILEHHPDRGGDPAEFVEGLREFDQPAAGEPAEGPLHEPGVVWEQNPVLRQDWPVSGVSRLRRALRRRSKG
jgi:hypothetical protein